MNMSNLSVADIERNVATTGGRSLRTWRARWRRL